MFTKVTFLKITFIANSSHIDVACCMIVGLGYSCLIIIFMENMML